jgi:hypothetical protein
MSETHAETDALKLKIDQARARLQAMEARYATRARKADTRRKIIAGALLFDAAAKDERWAQLLRQLLDRIDRPHDKKPFIGWPVPVPSSAREEGP